MDSEFKGVNYFLNIPASVAHDNKLHDKAKLLFGEIYSMLNVTDAFYMSNKKLADRLGCSTRLITDYVKELEDQKYIITQLFKDNTGAVVGREVSINRKKLLYGTFQSAPPRSKLPGGVETQFQGGIEADFQAPSKHTSTKKNSINRTGQKDQLTPLPPLKGGGQIDPKTEQAKVVIDYLNQQAGTNYRKSGQASQRIIKARLKEGFTVDDCKKVIDNKVKQWGNDDRMNKYLRPSTLFQASKFEGYLNQKPVKTWEEKEAEKYEVNDFWEGADDYGSKYDRQDFFGRDT